MNGRKVKALLDSGASHSFVSTRAAAELIASGAKYQKCELPILQGCIRAGVSRLQLQISIDIMCNGERKHLPEECVWVWDMGVDLLLCHAVIHEEGLSLAPIIPEDEILLEPLITRSGPFQTGEGESLLLSHLRERSRNTLVANLSTVALLSPPPGHRIHPERAARVESAGKSTGSHTREFCAACQAAQGSEEQADTDTKDEDLLRQHLNGQRGATLARFDGMRFEEILELRRSLLQQLRTPVEDVRRRLEEIKGLYPEAFSDTVETPCKLRKFEIKLKDDFRYYCFLPRRVSDPVLQEMKKQIAELLRQGVIQECHDSPWAFPIVMARRPGSEKLRLCIDYVLQNQQTVPLPFTIPESKEQLDKLAFLASSAL
jgi:hypothetical protein